MSLFSEEKIKILFLIRTLEVGGAERQLVELVTGLDKTRFAVIVAIFYTRGQLCSGLENLEGIKVVSLKKKGRWDMVFFFWNLWRLVCSEKPQIIHGYTDIPNLMALLMGKITATKIVWGLRTSNQDSSSTDWLSMCVFRLTAIISRFTDLIIVNSQAGKQSHQAHGFSTKQMIMIHNGIDIDKFYPNLADGTLMRQKWKIVDGENLIGIVGRLDPVKAHPVFLRAAALLAQSQVGIRFVCVGDGLKAYEEELKTLATDLGFKENLIWTGSLNNMTAVYNALDIVTSTSYQEGFSNVVAEAMACGVPVVVTSVGDSTYIVGDTGEIVPPGDERALVVAWKRILSLNVEEREALSKAARERVVTNFSKQHLVVATEAALDKLV